MVEIKKFAELLQLYNIELIEHEIQPLIGPGENYGSVMLAVEATVRENGEEENVSLVAKTCPPNEWIQAIFDSKNTFRKEICFYNEIIPALQDFLHENDVPLMDFYAPYVASRHNLEAKGKEFDTECVLILKNLKKMGYTLEDRMVGMDMYTTKVVLKSLAQFHAVPLAYKIKEPKLFNDILMPHLDGHPAFSNFTEEQVSDTLGLAVDCLEESSECRPLIDRFKKVFMEGCKNYSGKCIPKVEPFTTMTHNDVWTNNVMLKIRNGVVVNIMIVDFQMIDLGNPANDVLFFILSSARADVMQKFDDLVKYYYDEFITVLKKLNCDVEPFTYDKFLECIDVAAKQSQLYHLVPMLKAIYMRKQDATEMDDLSDDIMKSMAGLDQEYFTKLWDCVKFFAMKGWM